MNIENPNINQVKEVKTASFTTPKKQDVGNEFADELKENNHNELVALPNKNSEKVENIGLDKSINTKLTINNINNINKINNEKKLNTAIDGINSLVNEFNQSDDKSSAVIKFDNELSDNNIMINKDYNIQDKDILPQMSPNMSFSGNGQPFSSFMNNQNSDNHPNKVLGNSIKDLAEESAILSSMAENIAIAKRNQIVQETKTVINEEGIKEIDLDNGITIENIVKYDSIIMNQSDVEVFVELVEKGEVDLKNINTPNIEKSIQVSKTLNNLLMKSMENNQPLRIDFDNNISVIIRISRDGKISADFLPSSQIAEAYLKENLPLLRQKFEDNNIEYDSLNQRERKDSQREQNKKKGRNNE